MELNPPATGIAGLLETPAAAADLSQIRPAQTGAYLPNPGIGWQEGRTFANPLLPETVAYRRPQYSWRAQNPAEGVFDWSRVEADLQAAAAKGKQFSFRIYTMQGEPFGGHQLPQWVLEKGAVILPSGEPDYGNCVYQAAWASFVEAMRQQFDGNPGVAFIDISGYGNFNEWSWQDGQTEWADDSVDAQARQRLADMFIGGAGTVECRGVGGQVERVDYAYPGFQQTQLLMPYAGIQKSTRYVTERRPDVGIRHDCLGESEFTDGMLESIGDVISATWRTAPIVYEFCAGSTADPAYVAATNDILRRTHGSLVHDNLVGERSATVLTELLKDAGYRFVLAEASYPAVIEPGGKLEVSMIWRNVGYAPVYPRMGQDFSLHFYLIGAGGAVAQAWPLETDIAGWLPADPPSDAAPDHQVVQTLALRPELPPGAYSTQVAIVDNRTGRPINLAIEGRQPQGRYLLGRIRVGDGEVE